MIIMKEKGQIILALILVMVVALGIGLSIVQKSLVDLSTSSKLEDSSRAFSAAEAGIEKALAGSLVRVDFTENNSKAAVTDSGLLPAIPTTPGQGQAPLEYPPLAKEEVAHIWLADFNSISNPPAFYYTQPTLDVYWGNSTTDQAAIEITIVYWDGASYKSKKWYLDQITRVQDNGFTLGTCSAGKCKYTLTSLPSGLILLRARLLYNTTSQPFSVQAVGTCNPGCYLPPQARVFESVGTSGIAQRRVKVFQINKVTPPLLDYAIFSAGDLNK